MAYAVPFTRQALASQPGVRLGGMRDRATGAIVSSGGTGDPMWLQTVFMSNLQGEPETAVVTDQSRFAAVGSLHSTGLNRDEPAARLVAAGRLFGNTCWRHAYQESGPAFANRMVWFPSRVDYAFPGDFTVEAWVRSPAPAAVGVRVIVQGNTAGVGAAFGPKLWRLFAANGGVSAAFAGLTVAGVAGGGVSCGPMGADQWQHFAVCRAGGIIRGFRLGVPITEATCSGSVPQFQLELFGNRDDGGGLPNEWLQSGDLVQAIRITTAARYTGPFNPAPEPFLVG